MNDKVSKKTSAEDLTVLARVVNIISAMDAIAGLSRFCTVDTIVTYKEKARNYLLDKHYVPGETAEHYKSAIRQYCREKVETSSVFTTNEQKQKQIDHLYDLLISLGV